MSPENNYYTIMNIAISNSIYKASEDITPDIVLSLLGAGEPVADDDLNARDAYQQYLEEKYK